MTSLLAGFGDYIDFNEIDARWVARIAATFRARRRRRRDQDVAGCGHPREPEGRRTAGRTAIGDLRRPRRLRLPAHDGLHQRPGQHRQRQLRRARDRPAVLGARGRADVRPHVQQPLRPRSARSAPAGLRGPTRGCARAPTAPSTRGPTASARCFRGWATATAASWASPPSSSRVETGLVLRWFGGERWEFDAAGLPVLIDRGPGSAVTFDARRRTARQAAPRRRQGRQRALGGRTDRRARVLRRTRCGLSLRRRRLPDRGRGRGRRPPLRGRRGWPRAVGHRRRRCRRGRQRLRRAGPRHPPDLALRPRHPDRLPARPRDRHR